MKIITGMHRSGTSFTMNLLYRQGLDIGPLDKCIAKDKWNKKGYYENSDIVGLNNTIILGDYVNTELWNIPQHDRTVSQKILLLFYKSLYLVFPSPEKLRRRAEKKQQEIAAMCELYQTIGVKDPRFSLLLAPWCATGQIEKVLYCFRNPYEVAASIHRREKLPFWYCYKMWVHHVESFLAQLDEVRPMVCFIDFNNFFDAEKRPAELNRIRSFIGNPGDNSAWDIDEILDRGLKNNNFSGEQMPEKVAELYSVLRQCHVQYPEPAVYAGRIASPDSNG